MNYQPNYQQPYHAMQSNLIIKEEADNIFDFPISSHSSTVAIDIQPQHFQNNHHHNYQQQQHHVNFASASMPPLNNLQQFGSFNSLYSTSIPQSSSSFKDEFSPLSANPIITPSSTAPLDLNTAEKRRKRRESHNAVERRRRDTINEKIHELSLLIPDTSTPNDSPNSQTPTSATSASAAAAAKPNKGLILKRSVDYVRQMNTGILRLADRTRELENALLMLCSEKHIDASQLGLTQPLGTPIESILGSIIPSEPNSPAGMDFNDD